MNELAHSKSCIGQVNKSCVQWVSDNVAALPRREKRTVQRKTGLEDGLDRRENEGRVIQRQ